MKIVFGSTLLMISITGFAQSAQQQAEASRRQAELSFASQARLAKESTAKKTKLAEESVARKTKEAEENAARKTKQTEESTARKIKHAEESAARKVKSAEMNLPVEIRHIKIDRQFYGETSYGNLDGDSYRFYCQNKKVSPRINEKFDDLSSVYHLSDNDCLIILKKVDKAIKNNKDILVSLECKTIKYGHHSCLIAEI